MLDNSNAEQRNGNKYMQNFTLFADSCLKNDPFFSGFHEFAPPIKKYSLFAKLGTSMVYALAGSGGGDGDGWGGWW